MNATWLPKRNDQFVWREVEGGVYVLGHEGAMLRVLNATGALIWTLCDGTHAVEDICARLTEEFDVSPPDARRDVQEFLDELCQTGLIDQ